MENEHKEQIRTNYVRLVKDCKIRELLPLLLRKGVFSEDMIEKYQQYSSDIEMKRDLFLHIQRRGPQAFMKLIASLKETGQHNLADILDLESDVQDYTKRESAYPFLLPNDENIDDILNVSHEYSKFNVNLSTEPLKVMVKPAQCFVDPKSSEESVYKTCSKHRGVALIINIIEYINNIEKPRRAADVDERNLKELFTQIGLKVEAYENLKADEIYDVIGKFAANPYLSQVDMAVVVIMGHGNHYISNGTVIQASDGAFVEVSWIEERLNNSNCPFLQKKPKIIIYQVCRGNLPDYGTKHVIPNMDIIKRRTETDSVSKESLRTVSDMLIAHSTVLGNSSHRDVYCGSWYIQLICEIFMKHAHNKHVIELLSMVDERLEGLRSVENTMQTSSYTANGFKRCYFHPGIYLENGVIKKFERSTNN